MVIDNGATSLAGILDKLPALEAGIRDLEALQQRLEGQKIIPGEVAFRDPRDAYHQIALGAVLCAYDLSAHHARRLDGLLALPVRCLDDLPPELSDFDDLLSPDDKLGAALARFLDMAAGWLEVRGRYAEWRRGFERYRSRTEAYLANLDEHQLAELRGKPVSKKQTEMVRRTCACLDVEFPSLSNRGEAFDWLWKTGANPSYREMVR